MDHQSIGEVLAQVRDKFAEEEYAKLVQIGNEKLLKFIVESINHMSPDDIFICTDSEDDLEFIKQKAIVLDEEKPLSMDGHMIHFDGYRDQARDKANTRYLLREDDFIGSHANTMDKTEGLNEVRALLKDSMRGRTMIVRFSCLGPCNSDFSISTVQITDSWYLTHSEEILYRRGYEQFKLLGDSPDFFRFLHSTGRTEDGFSADIDKRRIYHDLDDEIVYAVNSQYAGNTLGFKKLALRLAIRRAAREGWLAEHMFIMGFHGPNERVSYFTGAFPSSCGKTSTAMIHGETIIGDDLAYIRKVDGEVRAVNVESGIFGIIRDVNAAVTPQIWHVLTKPGRVIFSNVLDAEGVPYWQGDGREPPAEGINHFGYWTKGVKDKDGNEVPVSHANARYSIRLADMENLDPKAEDPEGVKIDGMVFGGRDSDTWVPVRQAFDWIHGVISMGASLESESTAATLGQRGVRNFKPMSIIDFLSLPLGKYITNYLKFIEDLENPPAVFGVNYFLTNKEGQYITDIKAKRVWVKWMELRVHGDVDVLEGPTGLLPIYDDLVPLFKTVLDRDYDRDLYDVEFKIRIQENLAKIERLEAIYRNDIKDTPEIVFETLEAQRKRLTKTREKHGDYVSPFDLA